MRALAQVMIGNAFRLIMSLWFKAESYPLSASMNPGRNHLCRPSALSINAPRNFVSFSLAVVVNPVIGTP